MNRAKIFIALIFLSAFAAAVSAQNAYPNELKEYKLIGSEKLALQIESNSDRPRIK